MFMPRYARHTCLDVATNIILAFLFETLLISSRGAETIHWILFMEQITQEFAE